MADFKLQKIQYSFTETVSAAGTLTLTASSRMIQVITGSAAHTVQLPDATTMGLGVPFIIQNNSTGVVTVQNAGAVVLGTLAAGSVAEFFPTNIGSANGTWRTYASGSSANGGIGSLGPTQMVTPPLGLFSGGNTGGGIRTTIIDHFALNGSGGVAASFGALTLARDIAGAASSSTRGVIGGGYTGSASSVIDYVTFSTRSNALSFGNMSVARAGLGGCGSATRGVFSGSITDQNIIDYVTIATTGNATDFGDMSVGRSYVAACSSPTRGVIGGGVVVSTRSLVMDYITIATTGNAVSFGNLTLARSDLAGLSSSTRGVWCGGYDGGSASTTIDYITIATTGNATSFGTLTVAGYGCAAASSTINGVIAHGISGSPLSSVDSLTIATAANATAFGTLTARYYSAGCSSAHGGL